MTTRTKISYETPLPLPSAPKIQLATGLSLQSPLTRRGFGPGLIIIVPDHVQIGAYKAALDVPPLQKWAEEGFAVVEIQGSLLQGQAKVGDVFETSLKALEALPECDSIEKVGVILYDTREIEEVLEAVDANEKMVATISFLEGKTYPSSKPQLSHIAASEAPATPIAGQFNYPEAKSPYFILPGHEDFKLSNATVSHTRSLTFLKPHTGGPNFDLEAIWDEHTALEFLYRSPARTMATMVQEPYVNHSPTMTGGIGRENLTNFYRDHFIPSNPADTKLDLISRTIGQDRVIDEFVHSFTHDCMIDWLVPGIPATGKKVRVVLTAVVNIRGDRLYHEHIAWDQGTVLRQLGLLPEWQPWPYALPNGAVLPPGKKAEYRLPIAGVETADKMADESSYPSNEMLSWGLRIVDI